MDINVFQVDVRNYILLVGDIFLKIKDVDAQGWCTGLKDGHIGLYPESYAQPC
jgi:hypothetical protein